VNEFRAKTSADNADDHVVHVFEHKTASSATCAINFFGETHGRACTYVQVFGDVYLYSTGLMFPHLSTTNPPTSLKMTPSEANVALNRV
jgi:hypothetical protein